MVHSHNCKLASSCSGSSISSSKSSTSSSGGGCGSIQSISSSGIIHSHSRKNNQHQIRVSKCNCANNISKQPYKQQEIINASTCKCKCRHLHQETIRIQEEEVEGVEQGELVNELVQGTKKQQVASLNQHSIHQTHNQNRNTGLISGQPVPTNKQKGGKQCYCQINMRCRPSSSSASSSSSSSASVASSRVSGLSEGISSLGSSSSGSTATRRSNGSIIITSKVNRHYHHESPSRAIGSSTCSSSGDSSTCATARASCDEGASIEIVIMQQQQEQNAQLAGDSPRPAPQADGGQLSSSSSSLAADKGACAFRGKHGRLDNLHHKHNDAWSSNRNDNVNYLDDSYQPEEDTQLTTNDLASACSSRKAARKGQGIGHNHSSGCEDPASSSLNNRSRACLLHESHSSSSGSNSSSRKSSSTKEPALELRSLSCTCTQSIANDSIIRSLEKTTTNICGDDQSNKYKVHSDNPDNNANQSNNFMIIDNCRQHSPYAEAAAHWQAHQYQKSCSHQDNSKSKYNHQTGCPVAIKQQQKQKMALDGPSPSAQDGDGQMIGNMTTTSTIKPPTTCRIHRHDGELKSASSRSRSNTNTDHNHSHHFDMNNNNKSNNSPGKYIKSVSYVSSSSSEADCEDGGAGNENENLGNESSLSDLSGSDCRAPSGSCSPNGGAQRRHYDRRPPTSSQRNKLHGTQVSPGDRPMSAISESDCSSHGSSSSSAGSSSARGHSRSSALSTTSARSSFRSGGSLERAPVNNKNKDQKEIDMNNNNDDHYPDAYKQLEKRQVNDDSRVAEPVLTTAPPPPPPPPPPAMLGPILRLTKSLQQSTSVSERQPIEGAADSSQNTNRNRKARAAKAAAKGHMLAGNLHPLMPAFIPPQFSAPPLDGNNIKPSEYLRRVVLPARGPSSVAGSSTASGGSSVASSCYSAPDQQRKQQQQETTSEPSISDNPTRQYNNEKQFGQPAASSDMIQANNAQQITNNHRLTSNRTTPFGITRRAPAMRSDSLESIELMNERDQINHDQIADNQEQQLDDDVRQKSACELMRRFERLNHESASSKPQTSHLINSSSRYQRYLRHQREPSMTLNRSQSTSALAQIEQQIVAESSPALMSSSESLSEARTCDTNTNNEVADIPGQTTTRSSRNIDDDDDHHSNRSDQDKANLTNSNNLMNAIRNFDRSKFSRAPSSGDGFELDSRQKSSIARGPPGPLTSTDKNQAQFDCLLAATKRNLIAELKESKGRLEGIKRSKQKESWRSQGELKNLVACMVPQFKPDDFMEQVSNTCKVGDPEIPLWRRQMLAKKAAERARKECEARARSELEERQSSQIPAWKRQILAKLAAKKNDNQNNKTTVIPNDEQEVGPVIGEIDNSSRAKDIQPQKVVDKSKTNWRQRLTAT